MVIFAVVLLAIVQAQDARELVEKLRSDRIDEREKAARSLKALGTAAHPAVRAALRDPDPEVAARVAELFPVLKLAMSLPPRLLEEVPEALEAIAAKKEGAWTEAFLEASGKIGRRTRHPRLTAQDLVPLARGALQEAADDIRVLVIFRAIIDENLVELKPEIQSLTRSPDYQISSEALRAWVALGGVPGKDQVQGLLRIVRYGGPTRSTAIEILAKLRLKETAVDLIRIAFEDGEGEPVVDALLAMGAQTELLDAARKLLREPPVQAGGLVPVRPRAALLVGRLGAGEDVPLLEKAAKDTDKKAARNAADSLQVLKTRIARE